MMAPTSFYHRTELAWSKDQAERRRLHSIFLVLFLLFMTGSIMIPHIDLPEKKRPLAHKAPLPPRYARFLFEKQPLPEKPRETPKIKHPEKKKLIPKPVKPVKKTVAKPKVKPKPITKKTPPKKPKPKPKVKKVKPPKPKTVKKAAPKPKPKPKPAKQPAKPKKTPEQIKAEARAKINKMFGGLFDKQAVPKVPDELSAIHLQQATARAAAPVVHDVITSNITASEGIDSIQISERQVEAVQLAEPELLQIESSVNTELAEEYQQQQARLRSHSSIRLVFDREKGRQLNPLYTRALRYNPLLKGKVVLKLTISPEGRVISCILVSSQLHDPQLEAQLIERVRNFDFGARDVRETTVIYPIEFAPR